jgi:hypothetical protein
MATTEERLAAAIGAPDFIEDIAAFRKPKIGGCDSWEAASEQIYIRKNLVLDLGATTEV